MNFIFNKCNCDKKAFENRKTLCPTLFIASLAEKFVEEDEASKQLLKRYYKKGICSYYIENLGNYFCRCIECCKFLQEKNIFLENNETKWLPDALPKAYCASSFLRSLFLQLSNKAKYNMEISNISFHFVLELALHYCKCYKCNKFLAKHVFK